jgi:hypothetical protein
MQKQHTSTYHFMDPDIVSLDSGRTKVNQKVEEKQLCHFPYICE